MREDWEARFDAFMREVGVGEAAYWYDGGETIALDDYYTVQQLRAIAEGLERFLREEV